MSLKRLVLAALWRPDVAWHAHRRRSDTDGVRHEPVAADGARRREQDGPDRNQVGVGRVLSDPASALESELQANLNAPSLTSARRLSEERRQQVAAVPKVVHVVQHVVGVAEDLHAIP
jgi:hypothetical protein